MAISALRRAVDNTVMSHLSSAAMKTSTSMDGSDNKKTRHKLKKFLTRRPTLQAVRDKGYIKGTREQPVPPRNTNTMWKGSVFPLFFGFFMKFKKVLQAAKLKFN